MPADYTVQSAQPAQQWKNDYGEYQPYDLRLAGPGAPEDFVQLNRKLQNGEVPQDKVPVAGMVLYGTISKDSRGYRFKTERRDDGAPPQQSSNGSSQDGPDEAYWEAKNRAIQRQAAHKVMCHVYELGRTEGVFDQSSSPEQFYGRLRDIADWLSRDTDRAREPVLEAPPLT